MTLVTSAMADVEHRVSTIVRVVSSQMTKRDKVERNVEVSSDEDREVVESVVKELRKKKFSVTALDYHRSDKSEYIHITVEK